MEIVLYCCRTCKVKKTKDEFAIRNTRRANSCIECDAGRSSKPCVRCGVVLKLSEFPNAGKGRHSSYCLPCRRILFAETARRRRKKYGCRGRYKPKPDRFCRTCRQRKPKDAFSGPTRNRCRDCDSEISLRECSVCKEKKPLPCFSKYHDSYSNRCKDCGKRLWREAHERQMGWVGLEIRDKHGSKEWRKIWSALHRYGITYEQYMDLLAKQDGKCAICRVEVCPARGRLSIDHCHDDSGVIRGFLCAVCNAGLGSFQDSPELLGRAIQYLKDAESSTLRVGDHAYVNGCKKPKSRVPKNSLLGV